jgi:hypothetical protein
MIQRIQTLFLAAVVILSSLLLTGALLVLDNGSGTMFTLTFLGVGEPGGNVLQRLWPLTVFIALVPLLALADIFLYRKRRLQMVVTLLVLLLSLITFIIGAFYVMMLNRKIPVEIIWKVRAVFPLLSAILAWLAYRSILKDELLVRSYDRLR